MQLANAPASKKLKPVNTTVTRYEKGDKELLQEQYDPKDIQYSIFEHEHNFMYNILQLHIPGDVKDPTDLHIWKLHSEYLGYDGVSTVKLYWCPFKFQCNCSTGLMVKEGSDYILIEICSTHNKNSHNSQVAIDGNIF